MNKIVLIDICNHLFKNDATLNQDVQTIISKINSEKHRHFHTLEHVYNVFCELEHDSKNLQLDFLFAVCHDSVYEPKRSDNEFQSVVYISQFKSISSRLDFQLLRRQILETADLLPTRTNEADRWLVLNMNQSDYISYFKNIRKEYVHVEWETFKKKHLQIVENIWRCHRTIPKNSYCMMVRNWNKKQLKLKPSYYPSQIIAAFKEHGIFSKVTSRRFVERMEKWK